MARRQIAQASSLELFELKGGMKHETVKVANHETGNMNCRLLATSAACSTFIFIEQSVKSAVARQGQLRLDGSSWLRDGHRIPFYTGSMCREFARNTDRGSHESAHGQQEEHCCKCSPEALFCYSRP